MVTNRNNKPLLNKGRCFVIMPFSKTVNSRDKRYWTNTFQRFIRPSVEALGYECLRSVARPQNIIQSIIDSLFQSDIVLAILTDNNPNVWYELGVRHSIARGTIMAIEDTKEQHIPFDVAHYGVIKYNRQNRSAFQSELERFIVAIEDRANPDSPVKEYLAGSSLGIASVATSVAATPFHLGRIFQHAKHDLFFVGQNLFSLAKDDISRDHIFEWLHKYPHARVRILVVDPSENKIVDAIGSVIDESMKEDLTESVKLFLEWQRKWRQQQNSTSGRLEIRGSNRIGNVSFTFIDGDHQQGMALVRPILYHTTPKERPCFGVTKQEHRRIFEAYFSKYDQYWNHGTLLDQQKKIGRKKE